MDFESPAAWDQSLEDYFDQLASLFQRSETRQSGQHYLRGLLAEVKHKNTWPMAEGLGLPDPHYSGCSMKPCGRQRQCVASYGRGSSSTWGTRRGSASSMRVACEMGGQVRRGRAGKVEHCQVGVYLGYVAPTGGIYLKPGAHIGHEVRGSDPGYGDLPNQTPDRTSKVRTGLG